MLKLNRKKFLVESLAFPNLNTSHVKVKLELIKKQKGVFFLKENKDLDLNEKTKIIIQHLLELDLDLDEELPEEYQMFNIPAITEEEKQRIMEGIDNFLEKIPTIKD